MPTFIPSIETSVVHSGTYAAQIGSNTPGSPNNGDSFVYQDIQLPDGFVGLLPFNFYYWPAHPGGGGSSYIECYLLDLTVASPTPYVLLHDTSDTEAWTLASFDLSSFHGKLIRLLFRAHGTGTGNLHWMYLDDVSIFKNSVEYVKNGTFETGSFSHWKIGYPTIPVAFQALPVTMDFFGGANGGIEPPSQTATVPGAGENFTVTTNQSWLTTTPTSGTAPTTVDVNCSTVGLAVGTYTGTVTFTVDADTIRTIAVTLKVFTSGAPWTCPTDTTVYSQPWDGITGTCWSSQNDITGGNGNFATVYDNFTLADDTNITGVNFMFGWFNPTNPGTITQWTVGFWNDSSGPGTLIQSFVVNTDGNQIFVGSGVGIPDGGGDPFWVPVFSYKLTISFLATGGVKYWLSLVPSVGFPPQSGWLVGTGGDSDSYQDFFGGRTELTDDFVFSLCASPPPCLLVSPTDLGFTACFGGPNPGEQIVSVANPCNDVSQPYTVVVDQPWLLCSPRSGNTPDTLHVNVDVTGLAVGTYTGHITVTSDSISGSPAIVTVTLNVVNCPKESYFEIQKLVVTVKQDNIPVRGRNR